MNNKNTATVNNTEINPASESENPWKVLSDYGKEQSANTPESDDYYTFEGVEYRNIDKIDISTEQGKYEWLDSFVENDAKRCQSELEEAESEEDDELIEEAKNNLVEVQRKQAILRNRIDIDDKGVLENLKQELENARAKAADAIDKTPNERFMRLHQDSMLVWDLYAGLQHEMARRDPEYFGQKEMDVILKLEVEQAERRVERTMVDGYFGEDGFLHKTPNGEKTPTTATEDAEIDLKYAKQDAETFGLLMNNYQVANNYERPLAIKKEDFVPTIENFISEHSAQIDQINTSLKNLAKGTPEYNDGVAKRRKLASERNSARRLLTRYFDVPKSESAPSSTLESDADGGMVMEQISTGKTEEQIEAEKAKKRQDEEEAFQKRLREYWGKKSEGQQEKSPTSYYIEGGLVDKGVTIAVGQEIPDDWFEVRKTESVADDGLGLIITRDPKIDTLLRRATDVEFGKLSEDERRRYNYPALLEAVIAEARKTKRVPDIMGIINHQRAINDQREKVKQSYN